MVKYQDIPTRKQRDVPSIPTMHVLSHLGCSWAVTKVRLIQSSTSGKLLRLTLAIREELVCRGLLPDKERGPFLFL